MKHKLLPLILFAVPSFADTTPPSFNQGEVPPQGLYPYGYNAPAEVKLESDNGAFLPDFFIDASFIYYHADEEGLDLATSAALVAQNTTFVVVGTSNSKTAFQSFAYKPGFKVGAGARFSNWTLAGEYTWIRQTTHTNQAAPNANLSGSTPVWLINNWFEQVSPVGQALSTTNLSSKWHLSMNLADLMLSRPFYQSRHLTVCPGFGLKGAWISQSLDMNITVPSQVIVDQTGPVSSNNSSSSWAVGPRASLDTNLLLGMGFRLQGDLAASLLFTKYTHVTHEEIVASVDTNPSSLYSQYKNYCCTRPVAEMGIGFGWGSYLFGEKYHVDLSATYDFSVFWDQNMMRKLADSVIAGVGSSAGNLNLHGMTIKASFDF